MSTQLIVSDFYPEARQPKHDFLKRYTCPFLVVVGWQDESNMQFDRSRFNTQVTSTTIEDLSAFAKGKKLQPHAIVFPLVKRGNTVSGGSHSASVVMVGRAKNSDVILPSTSVSKSHFYISPKPFHENEYTLSDNGSTNGTLVNDKEVGRPQRVPLQSGDKISVGGKVTLRFYLSGDFWEILQRSFR